MNTLPIDESYGCRVRGVDALGIYFGRKSATGSSVRTTWLAELNEFAKRLDHFSRGTEGLTEKE